MSNSSTNQTYNFIYQSNEKMRLDKFISEQLHDHNYSRATIARQIKNGSVAVNEVIQLMPNFLLKQGDQITITLIPFSNQPTLLTPVKIAIPIIYEDDDLIVINKPNNLVVHPGSGKETSTLVHGLLYEMKQLSDLNGDFRPGIVHRLDRQTSGLMLVAKNNQSHYWLGEQLRLRKIKRVYLALVHGTIKSRSGTIDAPIARDSSMRTRMIVKAEKNAKHAITHFTVLENFKKFTLVQCQLETGRTHQIRVHFQWINHPVVNDPTYSRYLVEDKLIGQYLHAAEITFVHPTTKVTMTFTAPLPTFFIERLTLLRKEAEQ